MKYAERVRLHNLRHVENAAQLVGRRRDANREQCVTSFGRGDQVADRTDAADSRHQRRHLVKGRPSHNFSKPRNWVTWKRASATSPLFIKMQGDLGMALDAGHWIDDDGSCFGHLRF